MKLDDILKSARVPERMPGYWEHFPKRVTSHIGVVAASPRNLWWWAIGFATACLLIGLGISLRPQRETTTDYAKLYREVAAMFPHQVRAIVADENGVRLVLADKANVPASPPLLVRLCQPQRCRSVITFSGQRVRLNGETVEVLADGRGEVLVVGERSVLHPTEARAL